MKQVPLNVCLVLLALLLVLGSVLLSQLPAWRLDLTDEKLYSLSEGSKVLVKALPEPVTLQFYFSESLAQDIPQLQDYAQRIYDLLLEYQALSPDKISVEKVDPEPFSETEDEATLAGLQGAPINLGGDNLYMGLIVKNSAGGQVVIEFFSPERERFLEYDISQLLYRIAHTEGTVVGVVSSLQVFGGFDFATRQQTGPWVVVEQLQALHQVRELGTELQQVDTDVDVLMVLQPHTLPLHTLYAIDQFVLSGGRALVFVDPLAEVNPSAATSEGLSDVDNADLLQAWGIEIDLEKVVGDSRWGLRVGSEPGAAPLPHVGMIGLQQEAFDNDSIITTELETLNISAAGVIKPLEAESLRLTPLLTTSDSAKLFDRKYYRGITTHGELLSDFIADGEPYILAAQIQGRVKSAFEEALLRPQSVSSENQVGEDKSPDFLSQSRGEINVIVVTDVDLLSDRLWVQVSSFFGQRVAVPWANNGDFVINAVEQLAGSSELIGLRSRGQYARPFVRVDELRREAADAFKQQEEALLHRLSELEQTIASLSPGDNAAGLELSDAQQQEIKRFETERLNVRKELRQVQHQLNEQIEGLGRQLQWFNLALVPCCLLLLLLMFYVRRRRERH